MSISLRVFDEEENRYIDLLLTQEEYDLALMDNEYLRQLANKEKYAYSSEQANNAGSSLGEIDASLPHPINNIDDTPVLEETSPRGEEDTTATSSFIWTTPCVLLLLSLYEEYKENFNDGTKRHKKIWAQISMKMKEINGDYDVSGGQCQTKMNGLKRTYKKIKDHNKKSGNDTASWPFYQRMDEIFGGSGWAQPLSLASEAGPSTSDDNQPKNKKKKLNVMENYIAELKEERIQRAKEREQDRHEKKKLKEEQFKMLIELRERQHKEKMELIKSLLTK